jgi:hypothetical protein
MTFALANLPPVSSLSVALRNIVQDVAPTGTVILKMDKTGHWVFGADQTEVESDSKWAINPFSFIHGFIAWGDAVVLGEKMVPMSSPLPELDAAPAGSKRGWEQQIGFSLKCVSGEDKGMEVRYTTTSVGGRRAVQNLAVAIAEQVDVDQSKPVAVVVLKKDHYAHKSYGRIYTPVFEVLEWIAMDGETEVEAPALEAGGRRRRAAV